jgi:hypothetical protein
MKILAATKQSYSQTNYIVELNGQELTCLTTFYKYAKLPVTSAFGASVDRDRDAL